MMLQRIFFFKCLFEVNRDFLRKLCIVYLGEPYAHTLDPPFEGLLEYLKHENNELCKDYIEIVEQGKLNKYVITVFTILV